MRIIPQIFNPPLWIKIVMTIVLSVVAVIFYCKKKTKTRLYIMIAMLLSTFGDIFMTETIYLGDATLFLGAGGFMLAHVFYSIAALSALKKDKIKIFNKGFFIGLAVMVVTAIGLEVMAFTIPETPVMPMSLLLLVYIAFIGVNVCLHCSYGYAKKGKYSLLPVAAILFYVTDLWIFLEMLDIAYGLCQFVWYFYPLAQAVLIIFNDPLWEK